MIKISINNNSVKETKDNSVKDADVVDLFWARQGKPRPAQNVKCLVCSRLEKQGSIQNLCIHCSSDPSSTLTWVYGIAEATRDRLHAAGDAWELGLNAVDTATIDRFTVYQTSTDIAAKVRTASAVCGGLQGPLANLIRLHLDYEDAQFKSREVIAWVKQCEAALL